MEETRLGFRESVEPESSFIAIHNVYYLMEKKSNIYLFFIFSIIIFIITISLSLTTFYKHLYLKAIDAKFKIRGAKPVSDNIVIIAIDDQSFKELGQWPFPRSYYGKMIENLNRAGAKVIGLDVEFTEPSIPKEDNLLAQASARAGNIIFVGKVARTKTKAAITTSIVKPIEPLLNNASWGDINTIQDEDNFVRQYNLYQKIGEQRYYSLGIKILEFLEQKRLNHPVDIEDKGKFLKVGNYFINKYKENTAFINYYGPANTFEHYSLETVLDDSNFVTHTEQEFSTSINSFYSYLKNGSFKNKIVLVGATIDELHDLFPTPFYGIGKEKKLVSGIEIHANFLEMVQKDEFITNINTFYFLIGLLVFTILINLIYKFLPPTWNAVLGLLIIFTYGYLNYHLFVKNNLLVPVFEVPTVVVISYVSNLIYQYWQGKKERKFIRNAFSHYVSSEIVDEILKNPKKLKFGGEERTITLLFSDIRDFTSFSEENKSKKVVAVLKEYLSAMVKIIIENKGTVDKFVGDEIMALFGAPYYYEEHSYQACKTAILMMNKLRELQKDWQKRGITPLQIGIGISTGKVIVGNLGSEQIFDYTAIGDTVNIGARLEALNKKYETKNHILISETTYNLVKDRIETKFVDSVILKGKTKPVEVYEVIGLKLPQH